MPTVYDAATLYAEGIVEANFADEVKLKGGESVRGKLLENGDPIVILVGLEKKSFAAAKVEKIARGTTKKVRDFVQKKLREYRAAGSAKNLRKLEALLVKRESQKGQNLTPERRAILREVIKLAPDDSKAKAALKDALFIEGRWWTEEELAARVKDGYTLQAGVMVRKAGSEPEKGTTAVAKDGIPEHYELISRANLSKRELAKFEKDRAKRLKSAKKFLERKEKQYEGVPWEDRHVIPSRHFELHCNSTRRIAVLYSKLMEVIRAELSKMFKSRIMRRLKAPVFIYSSQEEFMNNDRYGRWGGRGLGGYYVPINQQIVTYHGTFGFTGTTFSVLAHEGTHYYQGLVLKGGFDNVPIWLIEGLAVYFGDGSKFDPKKVKIKVGLIPRDRLLHIQEKMEANRHTKISKLVNMTRGWGGFTGSHYADAWALIYFLVNSGADGQRLLNHYWKIGMERKLNKKDFQNLAKKYYGDIKKMEKEYVKYTLSLEPPPGGQVKGDYFVSDVFQFDLKLPSEDWQFFHDKSDKHLVVGMLRNGTSAEGRIYFTNNLENKEGDDYMSDYMRVAERRYSNVKKEPCKIFGLDGYKLTYVDEGRDRDFSIRIVRGADGKPEVVEDEKKKKKKKRGPREVVKYMLVQIDGVANIECSARPGERNRFLDDFENIKDSFSLTLTRRW